MSESTIIYDRLYSIANLGKYEGAVVIKYSNKVPGLLFGDKIILKEDPASGKMEMIVSGLRVFFTKNSTSSTASEITYTHEQIIDEIDYATLIETEIVELYDTNRYTSSTEDMIRFKKTQGLYYDMDDGKIDHRGFVTGEILNRSVAILKNSGIIIADQLGINEGTLDPIFYDTILITRENNSIVVRYEHWFSSSINDFRMVAILGYENF